jgi:hypothetical protein
MWYPIHKAAGMLRRSIAQEICPNQGAECVVHGSDRKVQIATEKIPAHQRIRNNFGWMFCTSCKLKQVVIKLIFSSVA